MNTRRLIVALDVPERQRALELAHALRTEVAMVKVGLEGFVAHGPELVRALVGDGLAVFLDLKLHDIPRTAARAASEAAKLGATLVTAHASGGTAMLRAARESMPACTRLLAVTVLTSLADADALAIGLRDGARQSVLRLGALAMASGADGLVCSAHELAAVASLGGLRVVPGIRPLGVARGDQQRTATPREALAAGASYIVVGRPIVEAADPVAAAQAINQELEGRSV